MGNLSKAFRALGDPTRLRILKVIAAARLNVGEVVSLVGVAQSSVSHHLTKLKALELIREERLGSYTYYSLAVDKKSALWPLIELTRSSEDTHGDQGRLSELLRRRDDVQTLNEKLLEPGQSWQLWSAALSTLLPPLDVVDFGCGTGTLTIELARWAKKVTAIDKSETTLARARAAAAREGLTNINFLSADLTDLPMPAQCADLVVSSQSLHHVDDIGAVLAEGARLLKSNGRIVVLELFPHEEEWVKQRLGHAHMGIEPEVLEEAMRKAGLEPNVQRVPLARGSQSPFKAFLVTGTRARKTPGRSKAA